MKDDNEQAGYWRLLLSHLPFIYYLLSLEQLKTLAEEMVSAALLSAGGREGEDCREPTGIAVAQLISVFLESESFVEMTVLQEQLLGKLCLYLSSLMRRRYDFILSYNIVVIIV